jgi:hypothetical protein
MIFVTDARSSKVSNNVSPENSEISKTGKEGEKSNIVRMTFQETWPSPLWKEMRYNTLSFQATVLVCSKHTTSQFSNSQWRIVWPSLSIVLNLATRSGSWFYLFHPFPLHLITPIGSFVMECRHGSPSLLRDCVDGRSAIAPFPRTLLQHRHPRFPMRNDYFPMFPSYAVCFFFFFQLPTPRWLRGLQSFAGRYPWFFFWGSSCAAERLDISTVLPPARLGSMRLCVCGLPTSFAWLLV